MPRRKPEGERREEVDLDRVWQRLNRKEDHDIFARPASSEKPKKPKRGKIAQAIKPFARRALQLDEDEVRETKPKPVFHPHQLDDDLRPPKGPVYPPLHQESGLVGRLASLLENQEEMVA